MKPFTVLRPSFLAATIMVLCLGLAPSLHAQSDATPQAAPDARAALAHQLDVLGWVSLSSNQAPRQDQLARAQILLDMATELAPDSPERWLLQAELARLMQEPRAQMTALQAYLKLEPKDDAKQLQLILLMLDGYPTLDQRLSRVAAILRSDAGQRLSAPLRSRLASYAASAALELGDPETQMAWLREAVKLDSTNAQAAQMILQLAQQQNASPAQLAAAAANLVAAAPADPSARLLMGDVLLAEAAYPQAAAQYQAAAQLAAEPLPAMGYAGMLMALSGAGDAASALDVLRSLELRPDPQASAQDEQTAGADAAAAPPVPAEPADPEEPVLPAEMEMLRLVLLSQAGRLEPAAQSLTRIQRGLAAAGVPEDEVAARMAVLAAVNDLAPEQRQQWLSAAPADDAQTQIARGWLAVHEGDAQTARQHLAPLTEEDSLAALGLAMLQSGPQQAEVLQQIVHRWPTELGGIIAARRLREMNSPLEPTRVGRVMLAYMDKFPGHLWTPALRVSPWVSFQIDSPTGRYSYLEPVPITLTLRNRAQLPLALSNDIAVPTQVVLRNVPRFQGRGMEGLPLRVLDMQRRLRLAPGESVTLRTRLDAGGMGVVAAYNSVQTMNVDTTAVLGPRATGNGGVTPAPVGGIAWLNATEIRGTPFSEEALAQRLQDAESADTMTRLRALAWLGQVVDHLGDRPDAPDIRRRIGEAVSGIYPQLSTVEQAWVVRFASATTEGSAAFSRVLDLAQRSDEPLVRTTYLAVHVDDPQSPAINAALRHDNPLIRTFAEGTRAGLLADAAAAEEQGTAEEGEAAPGSLMQEFLETETATETE